MCVCFKILVIVLCLESLQMVYSFLNYNYVFYKAEKNLPIISYSMKHSRL